MTATQTKHSIQVNFSQHEEAGVAIKILDAIHKIKEELFAEFKTALGANAQLLRLALLEAEALARETDNPELFFPLLASEKLQNAARWQLRQQTLLGINSPYPLAA